MREPFPVFRMMPYMSEALQLIVVECCDDVGDRARLQMKQFYIAFHNLVYKNKVRNAKFGFNMITSKVP